MFDAMVLPIIMYGCEAWGFTQNNILESFCFSILEVYTWLVEIYDKLFLYVNWVDFI